MCVSGYMLLKIRVGRSDYFLFIEIISFARKTFYKNRTGLPTFVMYESNKSKGAHAPPGLTPGHLTFLKFFGQIPHHAGPFFGQMPPSLRIF